MPITLEDVLQLECMENAILATKIQNPAGMLVFGITIIEAPDIADWINGGEILLSSFYSIAEDVEAQKILLQNLIQRKAAALMIKTSRFLNQIPRSLLQMATDANFPIIEIPASLHYVDIMYPIMSLLFNDQVYKLNYFKECHQTFTELLIHTQGTDVILQQLEKLVDNPVVLLDPSMQHIMISPTYNEQSWTYFSCPNTTGENQIISCQCSLSSDPHSPMSLWVRRVDVLERIYGHLGIVEEKRPVREMDFIALDNAVTTLRLEQLQNIIVQETENQFKNDFIFQLLHNQTLSADELGEKSAVLGLDLHKRYLVGNIEFHGLENLDTEGKPLDSRRLFHSQLKALIEKVCYYFTSSKDFFYTLTQERMLFLWPCSELNRKEISEIIRQFIMEFKKELLRFFPWLTFSCGIGNPVNGVILIKNSYAEAADALWVAKQFQAFDSFAIYQELGIYKLLSAIRDFSNIQSFIPEGIRALQIYDTEKNQELILTLEAYFSCELNAVKTSEMLFLHHKTVLYRLKKIKEILGTEFTDHEQRLELKIGLKILHMIKE